MARFPTLCSLSLLALSAPSLAAGSELPADLEPSLEERALHFQTDRLRVDPGATDVTFDTYPAVAPLLWQDDLHAAARFYADDIDTNGCFPADHSSCDGTPFSERLRSFYSGSSFGENIARGQPSAASAVFESWLYSDGHRENMLSPDWDELGTGHAAAGQPVWVQDFGVRGGVREPAITSATHEPLLAGVEEELRFFAAVFEPSGQDLSDMQLVVTSACKTMDLDRGGDGKTTYVATAETGPEGCMPYWFLGTTEDGDLITFPSEGSLLAPVGGATCATWTPERRGAECAPEELGGFTGAGGGCASGGEDAYPDANVGENVEYGTCQLGGSRAPRLAWLLAMGGLLLVRRRR